MGKWVAKGRAMAREFQTAIEDMAREAELDKVKSEIEKAGRTNLGKTIENTIDPKGELGRAFDPNAKRPPKARPPSARSRQAAAEPPKPVAADQPASDRGRVAAANPPASVAPSPTARRSRAAAAAKPEAPAAKRRRRRWPRPQREAVPADLS